MFDVSHIPMLGADTDHVEVVISQGQNV